MNCRASYSIRTGSEGGAPVESMMNRKNNAFFADIQNYVHTAPTFLDRGLLELLEKDFDFHNMAFTHYSDGKFVSAMSYVTNVPTNQVMLMRREYYRARYFHDDDLAHYVTNRLSGLPSFNDCGPILAKQALSDEQLRNYASFFAPYQIQDAAVLPLDRDSRITIFHKNDLPPWTEEDVLMFGFLQKTLQLSYAYWKEVSRVRQLTYMKDRIINEHRVALALFDGEMNLLECNSLFYRAVTELYRSSDLNKCIETLLTLITQGETETGPYEIRFNRSDFHTSEERKRAYSCIRLEEKKQPITVFSNSSERKTLTPPNRISLLTDREVEVMTRYCSGRTAKQIAQDLFISEWTVKAHIKNIYKKLNVSNQRQLISEYLQLRIN